MFCDSDNALMKKSNPAYPFAERVRLGCDRPVRMSDEVPFGAVPLNSSVGGNGRTPLQVQGVFALLKQKSGWYRGFYSSLVGNYEGRFYFINIIL